MIVCAVFEVEGKLVPDVNGEFCCLPVKQCIGYAVFENGVMISPMFHTYAEAENWMQAELEARESQSPSSPGMGMR
jgi:hypothetical protein